MKVFGGRYRILKKLGEGFGGRVFLAETDGGRVALKKLHMEEGPLSPDQILENFKREFSTLKELNHPHIVRILDFGYDAKEKAYYFTTEYIEGPDILQATRGLKPEAVEDLFVQALRALSYLHSRNVFHLDLKPSNILVGFAAGGQKTAQLIDFGLARFQSQGFLVGSPFYMAPESFVGEPKDGRSDLYSLGVTWYECLTGKNPFRMSDLKKTVELQRSWDPPRVTTQAAHLPAYLDAILEKLMRKKPAERYHRADQVIRDLNWSGGRNYPLETEATALAYLPGEGQLIGREAEWGQLVSIFERVFVSQTDHAACAILDGPPGTGKSRLLKELKYHAELQTIPVHEATGVSFPEMRDGGLLLVDDASDESIALAEKWLKQFRGGPLMIVLAGNGLKEAQNLGQRIVLGNFDRSGVLRYIASVVGISEPPSLLVDELLARTEGSPLLLTEVLRSLIRSHQIFDSQGRWSPSLLSEVGLDFGKLASPRTLTEYCAAKFARLSPGAGRILTAVALARSGLHRDLLAHLCTGADCDWDTLREEGLVTLDPVTEEARLLNPNFRDWIPRHVDPETVASVHQALGDLLKANPATENDALFHLGFGQGDAPGRSAFLSRYGETLASAHRWVEAADIFGAASRLGAGAEERVEGRLRQVRALFRAGLNAAALVKLEETRELLRRERDDPRRWKWVQQTLREMASLAIKVGRLDRARETLESSRTLLEEHQSDREEDLCERMILDNFRASLLFREGKIEEASVISEETYRLWRTWPLPLQKQVLNNELGSIYLALRRAEEAAALSEKLAQFCETVGNLVKRAYALYTWAESCYALNRMGEAASLYQTCVDLCRSLKNEELLFHAFNGLGNIAYLGEDWGQAAVHYQNALDLAHHNASLESSVAIALNLAIVLRRQGDSGRARAHLRHVIDTLEAQFPPSLHQLQFLTQGYLELGHLSLGETKWLEARDSFRDAARLVRHHPGLEALRFNALMGLAKTALEMDLMQEAHASLAELEKLPMNDPEKKEWQDLKRTLDAQSSMGNSA